MAPIRDGRDASPRRPSREVGGLGDPALPIIVSGIFHGIRSPEDEERGGSQKIIGCLAMNGTPQARRRRRTITVVRLNARSAQVEGSGTAV